MLRDTKKEATKAFHLANNVPAKVEATKLRVLCTLLVDAYNPKEDTFRCLKDLDNESRALAIEYVV